jgi:GNAT superfamily N-acetyltransferase
LTNPDTNRAFAVRRCRMGDVLRLSDLLKVCWHSTYDEMVGRDQATRLGQRVYSRFNLGPMLALAPLSRPSAVLVAAHGQVPVGYAMAQHDGASEVILYGLYVHPEWQGKGIGSALLDAVVARFPDARAVRLEVLKDNAAAVTWYQAKGFQCYGETPNATGMVDIASMYMDKQLDRPRSVGKT